MEKTTKKKIEDFCVFILTHGRPDNVYTYDVIRKKGYDGPVYFILDNEDPTYDKYAENFGAENIIVFDKEEAASKFDEFDNFKNRKAIVYARNACFDIAKKLGYTYFLQLDDVYKHQHYMIITRAENITHFQSLNIAERVAR